MTQPAPSPGTGDVWLDIIEDIPLPKSLLRACVERRNLGIARYGTPLQYGNGRDPEVDLHEELLDGAVYAWQAGRRWVARLLLVVAWWVGR